MHLHNFLKSLREQVQTALRHFLAHSLCSLFSVDKCQQAVESQRKRLIVRPRGILGFNLSCVCLSLSPIMKKKLLLKLPTGERGKFKRKAAAWKTSS